MNKLKKVFEQYFESTHPLWQELIKTIDAQDKQIKDLSLRIAELETEKMATK